ncbi:MAG TPA: DUF6526 family protein [Flavisolibacter sp.]|nr:DUF6526 family protein [Flavisolibacter sp.]
MKEQNYKNHRQVVYSYYLLTGVPIIVLIVIAARKVFQNNKPNHDLWIIALLIGWILLTMLFRSRGFALKAQDRAIRAEESLRYFMLTGKAIDARLTVKQVIALRFASDAEVVHLAKIAVEQNLKPDAIKREIKSWRPDFHRV